MNSKSFMIIWFSVSWRVCVAGRDDVPAGGGAAAPAAPQLPDGPPVCEPADARHFGGLAHPSTGDSLPRVMLKSSQLSRRPGLNLSGGLGD